MSSVTIPIEGCVSAKPFKPAPERRVLLLSLVVLMYTLAIPYCYFTAGEPRRIAMIHAQKLADEKWERESALGFNSTTESKFNYSAYLTGAVMTSTDMVVTTPMDSTSSVVIDPLQSTTDIDAGYNAVLFPETDESIDHTVYGDKKASVSSTGTSMFDGWFGPTKEQKRAQAEFEKWQKSFKEKLPEDGISLPSAWLPSAGAVVLLLITVMLHALFHLLCHWLVDFKALALYAPASRVDEQCFVLVQPPPNRGKAALVPVKRSATTKVLQIDFQRQTYVYTPTAQLGGKSSQYPHGVFTLHQAPVNLPLSQYRNSKGLSTDAEVERTVERWGKNHLQLHTPSFIELLQTQLIAPLAVFQVFCALLWLLDEYWSYTLWSLASVIIFESVSVFQRTRTQAMLGGMSPAPAPVYVFRSHKWVVMSSRDLLPGDLLSVAYSPPQLAPVHAANSSSPVAIPITAVGGSTEDTVNLVPATARSDIVPCDCLLLTGSAIVNEASLTGESVPQMKECAVASEPITESEKNSTTVDRPSDVQSSSDEVCLDMQGRHRVHTLFSGTSLVTVRNGVSDAEAEGTLPVILPGVPTPPDGGAIAFVLRTGFSSSQGALLQMVEFSQQVVSGDAWEIGYALLLLFCFALVASGYVLKEGLRKREKTTHELLLKCVIIITSVVPRELPMQMAMAVNMALMTLNKAGVFCTEPHRVPLGGKITHCLFDKTGTLTTDQLVPVGIVPSDSTTSQTHLPIPSQTHADLQPVRSATNETAMVLAACHSLVVINQPLPSQSTPSSASAIAEGNLVGDPIEVAAIKGVEWTWHGGTSTATPGNWQSLQATANQIRQKIEAIKADITNAHTSAQLPQGAITVESLAREEIAILKRLEVAKARAHDCPYGAVQVMQRFHFSSQLQRMSVLCKCTRNKKYNDSETNGAGGEQVDWFALVKGSPEAVYTLLTPGQAPQWYTACYDSLARKGLRVLALAYKQMDASLVSGGALGKELGRGTVESALSFAGFIAFECKVRADSRVVVRSLLESDHRVAMLTGDALLTSLHVAKQVDICDPALPCATLTVSDGTADWVARNEGSGEEKRIPFESEGVRLLSKSINLLTTEKDFVAAVQLSGGKLSPLWAQVDCFKVFARMSPTGKATVIRAIQTPTFNISAEMQRTGNTSVITANSSTALSANVDYVKLIGKLKSLSAYSDAHVLMCGDGGNDVGALKQADVGLALLAGHANTNTTEDLIHAQTTITADTSGIASGSEVSKVSAEDALNAHEAALRVRGEAFNKARQEHMKRFQAEYNKRAQLEIQEQVKKLTEEGNYTGMWSIMKEGAMKTKRVLEEENKRFMAQYGHIWDPRDGDGMGGQGGLASMLSQMEQGESASAGGLPMIRPGDASVAAPFTSRTPSVRAVVDLIRQGRCTLLSALMQQQIMMLESTIAAYSLSALSLHNARSSERQLMASQWLILTAAVSFSYSSPLDHMHPLRPLKSLFHPAIIFSILGQAAIHIACMTLAVQWATDAMGPDQLREVTEFFRKVKSSEIDRYAQCGEDDFVCQMNAFWTAPFLPNLLNSVVFLVQTAQMISVFFANYKGRPWMKGMMENHALFLSVFICVAGVIVASWEMIPQMNTMLQLTPFPDDAFRYKVVGLVLATIAGTLAWDRICVLCFAPEVFAAMMAEVRRTTWRDVLPILNTVAIIVVVLAVISTGNILLIIGAGYYGRQYYMHINSPEYILKQKQQLSRRQ